MLLSASMLALLVLLPISRQRCPSRPVFTRISDRLPPGSRILALMHPTEIWFRCICRKALHHGSNVLPAEYPHQTSSYTITKMKHVSDFLSPLFFFTTSLYKTNLTTPPSEYSNVRGPLPQLPHTHTHAPPVHRVFLRLNSRARIQIYA